MKLDAIMPVIMLMAVVGATWLAWAWLRSRGGRGQEESWLPDELRGARLAFSEKQFHVETDRFEIPVRLDRAYEVADGEYELMEFKTRHAPRAYTSDIVELTVQAMGLAQAGHSVRSRAWVVAVHPETGRHRPVPVTLESAAQLKKRMNRYVAIKEGREEPEGASSSKLCSDCGHRRRCDKALV